MNTFTTRALTVCTGLMLGLSISTSAWSAKTLEQVMKDRGLTQKNVLAAAKTYTPTGGRDEFIAFSSGGQSGHVIVYGIPSMRILKYIGVFINQIYSSRIHYFSNYSKPKFITCHS